MYVLVNNCCGCRVAAVKTIVVEVVEWLRVSWGWCVCSMIHAAKEIVAGALALLQRKWF
jgi:hypothetical protein